MGLPEARADCKEGGGEAPTPKGCERAGWRSVAKLAIAAGLSVGHNQARGRRRIKPQLERLQWKVL